MSHQCVDGSAISPGPWRVVPSKTPYGAWIIDRTGGMVCAGFGTSDEALLLHAPLLLATLEALRSELATNTDAIDKIDAVLAAVRGTETTEGGNHATQHPGPAQPGTGGD